MKQLREDIALLALRVVVGLIFLPHGYSKVFGPGGAAVFAQDMPSYGIPILLGYMAAYGELTGSILLVLGLFARLDALVLCATMMVATFVVLLPDALREAAPGTIRLFATMRGIEMTLLLAASTFALLLLGPGRFSLDRLFKVEARVRRLFAHRADDVQARES